MRVLIVASYNKGRFVPFIEEQVEALRKQGVTCEYFGIEGKGIRGYLRNLPALRKKINGFQPNLIHAHYGLSGLLANLQRKVPVITTYHGSDINDKKVLPFSKLAMRLSAFNIFVSQRNIDIAKPARKYTLMPCGINLDDFPIVEKDEARENMSLVKGKKFVLFAGAFDNAVKDAPLAKEVVSMFSDVELLELKGCSRQQVASLMCAVDAFLMTSRTEGSPQVIKEAMACGCPIVSVDVGDVKERIHGVDGCFVSETRDATELAALLQQALSFENRTHGRERIVELGLTNDMVAKKLMIIYQKVLQIK